MTDEAMWGRFARDPREPENRELLASDADREVVAQALADAFADGRLDPAEFDRRSTAVRHSLLRLVRRDFRGGPFRVLRHVHGVLTRTLSIEAR